jgi:hypothetical protein
VVTYGGLLAFRKAFGISTYEFATRWRKYGVPPVHSLSLFLGLRARGHEPSVIKL